MLIVSVEYALTVDDAFVVVCSELSKVTSSRASASAPDNKYPPFATIVIEPSSLKPASNPYSCNSSKNSRNVLLTSMVCVVKLLISLASVTIYSPFVTPKSLILEFSVAVITFVNVDNNSSKSLA